jgi:hypothetical protein
MFRSTTTMANTTAITHAIRASAAGTRDARVPRTPAMISG